MIQYNADWGPPSLRPHMCGHKQAKILKNGSSDSEGYVKHPLKCSMMGEKGGRGGGGI
jgi:hypothetical protein